MKIDNKTSILMIAIVFTWAIIGFNLIDMGILHPANSILIYIISYILIIGLIVMMLCSNKSKEKENG